MPDEQKAQPQKKIDPKDRQLTIAEYRALQAKENKKFKGIKLPLPVKIFLALPLILIALFGLYFIPLMGAKLFITKDYVPENKEVNTTAR